MIGATGYLADKDGRDGLRGSTVLQFGIFDHLERPRDVALDQAYDERLRLLTRADELGYYGYHLAEHHQSPLCMAPSQNVFLAAAARGTRRIKLGTLVHLLPMHHPLRFIEEVCMLDNLTQGRMQIGLGRGITAIEHTYWGLRPEEAQRRYQETLEIIVQGLTSDTLTHHGEFFDFDNVPLEMTPKQQPYPPLWYASNTPDDAARDGLNFVTRPGARLPDVVARYKQLWEEHRHRPGRLNAHVPEPMIGSSRHIVVADTDAEAERIARTAWPILQDNFSKRGMDGPGPETRADGSMLPVPPGGPGTVEARDFDRARRAEGVLVGSPDTVGEYVQRYAEESGANYFMAAFQWGNISHAQAAHSLELFATRIMSRFGAVVSVR
jgi:alkanesulfonate monooxygenase SsuD/methylene tetrahydromethanopterin reductase-like flavin-dependent oxidoreductase (luciferase family)